jgi:hypothetical protein
LQPRPALPLPVGLRVALPPAVVLPGVPALPLLALQPVQPVQPVALPQAPAARAQALPPRLRRASERQLSK